jgi:hypothetical protein
MTLVACLLILVAVGAPVAADLVGSPPVSGTVPVQTNSGLTVNVSGASNLNADWTDDTSVSIQTDTGNVTMSAPGSASVNITADNTTGTWTNVTAIGASSTAITIDPEDKPAATVEGDTDRFAFRDDVSATDGEPDFYYAGSSGETTVTVRGVGAGIRIIARDQTGTTLGSGTSTSAGAVTISGMPNSEHTVTLTAERGPYVDTADPDGEYFDNRGVELNATVVDPQGDDFEKVELQHLNGGAWTTVATESGHPSGTEINASISANAGENTWRVIMNATGNRNVVSDNYTFTTPGAVRIYNASSNSLADTKTVTGGLSSTESNYQDSVSTGTGVADLNPVSPPQEVLRSDWSASGFANQSLVIRDPAINESVVAYETGAAGTYTQCFSVNDPTGTFSPGTSWVVVEGYIDGEWRTVGSDYFGVENEATIVLEDGTNYRVRLRNENGDLRVLGTFTGDDGNSCVPLSVTTTVEDPEDPATANHNATCVEDNPKRVRFQYNDTTQKTETIYYTVYEYQNESNVLVPNTTFAGDFGDFGYTANVPSSQNNTSWTVQAIGVRDGGEDIRIRQNVCGATNILPSIPPWLATFSFVGIIWITAGLFSELNGDIGGLVVAGLGGMFWMSGIAPPELGAGVVALSLMTAGILFVRERSGGGL